MWQRVWDKATKAAVAGVPETVAELAPSCVEITWRANGETSVAWPSVDFETLRASRRPVNAVMRVGPRQPTREAQTAVCAIAIQMLERLRQGGVKPVELQVDFDCAERNLGGYRPWLAALRTAAQPVPVRPTCLPAWLGHRDFAALARESGAFILQVHATEKPTSHAAGTALCEASNARRWVEQAGRLGVPFRVALPTYTYRVAFAADGTLLGIEAEGEPRLWPRGTLLRAFRPDAAQMAALVKEWKHDRPAGLTGLLWYRLPVASDTMNWRWPTLAAVMQGREPVHALRLEQSHTQPADIRLINDGEAEEPLPRRIFAKCTGGIEAADGIGGYRMEPASDGVSFVRSDEMLSARLRPGEQHAAGWIRAAGVIGLSVAQP